MHTTSITLLERLRQSEDAEAWNRFVDLYTPLLFGWARRAGLQSDDAADLVQEVFATLVKKFSEFRYDSSRSFRGWLRTVMVNLLRDRLRALATRPLNTMSSGDALIPDADTVAELAENEYRDFLVQRALQLMRRDFAPPTWQAVWAHIVDGQSANEAAANHGLTVGAMYGAKFRILGRLRTELNGLLD